MNMWCRWILWSGLLLTGVGAYAADTMSVQVQSGQIRETPSFLGRVVATVAYADIVTVTGRQGPWSQVRNAGGQSGWMHESALSRKRIVLKAGSEDVSRTASGEELALAGKGFNSKVEADFRDKNQNIDFTWIDRMETYRTPDGEIVRFLREGGLP